MPDTYAELTVEQMLADDVPDGTLSSALRAIRHTASDAGITVTVDLHGKLVDLAIGHPATRQRATTLAAEIQRLAELAAAAALAEALDTLATGCDPALAATVRAHLYGAASP